MALGTVSLRGRWKHIKHTDYLYILGNEELTFHQNKPQSYLAIISYDTGILGVSIILFFLLLFIIRARNRGFQPAVFYVVKYGLLAVAFGWMGLFALIPHLMPWLVLCYVYSLFVGQTRQHQNVLARQKLSLCIA
jgi:asparagine N-glycosylation enzyme membrane subunit Stt3